MSATIRAEMIATIRGITPTEDAAVRFVCADDATGARASLELAVDNGRTRVFDIRSISSVDLGQTGVTSVRYAEQMVVRVGYHAAQVDGARLDRMMAQDARDIIRTLRNPANFGSADALVVGQEPPGISETENGLIQAVPVTVVYVQ